ncbi:MAG: glycosyltransferase, partial [Candidatus Eremiobacteraeota bacterium]|nr:glycosyltransferase [Candidatus Eremiobacteraeota bacterium]
MKRRVAILTPWFGEECIGGAERQASELARRLSARLAVTVLTTTSRSFHHTWDANYHKPGRRLEAGYEVLRFSVTRRDADVFNRVNQELLGLSRERWREIGTRRSKMDAFIDESINSPQLEKYLRRQASHYDAIVALPYLYGVVVRGIEAAQRPVHLIPCLHDEAYARIPRIEDAFHAAAGLLFNSAGEAELALRLYGPGILHKSYVVGEGIESTKVPAGANPISGRYYLYLGRREPEKGLDSLLDAFGDYRSNGSTRDVTLVLAGPGERSYENAARGVRDLGFVDESTKHALLRDALALLNPSQNESYSRVLMEAWREGVPVVAHGSCLATSTAVRESEGGLIASTREEWIAALHTLETMQIEERRTIGARGSYYASANADWEAAIQRLEAALGLGGVAAARKGKRIDQVLEAVDAGDAISDEARGIRRRLHALGYDSSIYALHVVPGVDDASQMSARALGASDALIYHHSIGSDAAEAVLEAHCRKAVIYHNLTPPRFFAPYMPDVVAQLERGREQLARLAVDCDLLVGDSDFNADELRALGARNVRALPVATEMQRFDVTPHVHTLRADHGTRWLFVGRVSPNKGIGPLIEAFKAYLALDEDATLTILGKYDRSDRYYNELKSRLAELRIDPYVTFTGYVEPAKVVAHYRNASVFVCLSEHEGFCVPLVEAMFFDVPIVAKALTAVPGTLSNAGILLEPEAD